MPGLSIENSHMQEKESESPRESDSQRQQYWDEISLIEDLRAFHPKAFDELPAEQQEALLEYYALDKNVPDVFAYKLALDASSPESADLARRAYTTLKQRLGIKSADGAA
jgi:hypothetical protein